MRIQTVSPELAEGLRLKEPKGALVASVTKDGPADKAGIKQGDVVLKFDGKDITQMRGLPRIVAETETGKTADVVIWRQGKEVTLKVAVGELTEEAEQKTLASIEAPASAIATIDSLGLKLSAMSDELRKKHQIPDDAEGVVVVEVAQTGPGGGKGHAPRRRDRGSGPEGRDLRRGSGAAREGGAGQRLPGGHAAGQPRRRVPVDRAEDHQVTVWIGLFCLCPVRMRSPSGRPGPSPR